MDITDLRSAKALGSFACYIFSVCCLWLALGVGARAELAAPLVLGIHPYLPATDLHTRFQPFADYLGNKLGLPVHIRIAKGYQEHIEKTGQDELDLAYLGPAAYVKLVQDYGPKPILARLEVNGEPRFHGVIVASAESALAGLSDLKGKRFAFGDRFSTMSHLVPRYVMLQAGVELESLASYEYLGSHRDVVLGVLMGDFDAGAIKEEVYAKYRARGLRQLALTPPISEHVFVSRSTLAPETIRSVRQAMLELGDVPEGDRIMRAIKDTVTGLVSGSDDDYQDLRRMIALLVQQGFVF